MRASSCFPYRSGNKLKIAPAVALLALCSATPWLSAQTVLTGNHQITGSLIVDGDASVADLDVDGSVTWGASYYYNGQYSIAVSGYASMAGGNTSESGKILASGSGAIALGYADSAGQLVSSGVGSIALGMTTGSFTGGIRSTGWGSFAVGMDSGPGITASGMGSVAMGYASWDGAALLSSGTASFALGQSVQATADNAFALGSNFTNSTASTFKVGFNSTPTLTVSATQVNVTGNLTVSGAGSGITLADGTTLSGAQSLRSTALYNSAGTAAATVGTDGKVSVANSLAVGGDASAAHVSAVSAQAGAGSAFYGRQVGASFADANSIFSAVTDNTNGSANWFFRGKKGGESGTETFSIRADGTIKSAALAPGGTSDVLVAVKPDGTLVRATPQGSIYTGSLKADRLTVAGAVTWGADRSGSYAMTITASGSGNMAGGATSEAGYISANGWGAIALGQAEDMARLSSDGAGSVALGFASGNSATSGIHATSYGSFAVGANFGQGITSSGLGSVAMGYVQSGGGAAIISSGTASFALGQSVQATADNAFALGSNFTNSNASTFKVGFGPTPTLTVSANQVALGHNNVAQGNPTTWVPTDDLVVVGNGDAANTPSNALAVHKNGNTRIAGDLDVRGVVRVKPAGDISMGDFTATPVANRDPATLNAGLRYPGE